MCEYFWGSVEYCVLFDHFLSHVVASVYLTIHLPGFERVLLNLSNQVAIALTKLLLLFTSIRANLYHSLHSFSVVSDCKLQLPVLNSFFSWLAK